MSLRDIVSNGIAKQAEMLTPRDILFAPPKLDLAKTILPAEGVIAPFGIRVVENPYLPENTGVMFDSQGRMTILKFDNPAPVSDGATDRSAAG